MAREDRTLRNVRDTAASALRLCDEIVASVGHGKVLGARKGHAQFPGESGRGQLVAKGSTPRAAQRDYEFKLATLLFFLLARDLFKSIVHLERAGAVLPANIVLRSLFETMISLRYMQTDPHQLAHRFFTHEYAQQYESVLRRRKAGLPVDPIWAARVEAEWEKVKDTHATGESKDRPARDWHGKQISEIWQALRPHDATLETEYDRYYGRDSELVHVSVRALGSYAARRADRHGWVLCPPPPDLWRLEILLRSLSQILLILEVASEVLSLGVQNKIEFLWQALQPTAAPPTVRREDAGAPEDQSASP